MEDSRILVTGGAGFIGSHLVDALLARGQAVRVLDNFSTGKWRNLPSTNPLLDVVVADVADANQVNKAIEGVTAVVHLAAVASVQASVDDPLGTHQSNFIGTLNIAEAMRREGVKRIVFASSAAVYGQNGQGQAIAEDTTKAPLTPYAIDKLSSEQLLEFYQRQHGLEPAIFRFFNIFGPRQDPSSPYSGVISIFVNRILNAEPIKVFGDGGQTRDFVYVGDLVKLLMQALDRSEVVAGAVNLGLGRATSLNQLLQALAELENGLPPLEYLPAREGDIRHSQANNLKLLRHYSFGEPTGLDAGLEQLLAWAKQ